MNNHTKSAITATVGIVSLISMVTSVEYAINASPYMQDQLMLSGLMSLIGAILSAVAFWEYDRRVKAEQTKRREYSNRLFYEAIICMAYEQGRHDERKANKSKSN